jgi:hypothetical protein
VVNPPDLSPKQQMPNFCFIRKLRPCIHGAVDSGQNACITDDCLLCSDIYYRVIVRTGLRALDAEANAYVVLIGEDGKSDEFQLEKRGKNAFETDGFVS